MTKGQPEKTRPPHTLSGGVGFLPNGSDDANRSDLSVFLKKSSEDVPLKGSVALNGSPPKASTKHKRQHGSGDTGVTWLSGQSGPQRRTVNYIIKQAYDNQCVLQTHWFYPYTAGDCRYLNIYDNNLNLI